MTIPTQEHRGHGFAIGLLTGTVIGAGLALWLAPRAGRELRRRLTNSALMLGDRASEKLEQATARVKVTVGELTSTGNGVRDDVAGAVARGAHEVARGAREVERLAIAAKSGRS